MDAGPHRCLAADLARGLFAGRAAVWGLVVPLGGIVAATLRGGRACAIALAATRLRMLRDGADALGQGGGEGGGS